jgi:hypothetical protein
MGRRVDRNKMQYYAISNTGTMNTKLPLKNKGRSCTDERGCDEIFTNFRTIFINFSLFENSAELFGGFFDERSGTITCSDR